MYTVVAKVMLQEKLEFVPKFLTSPHVFGTNFLGWGYLGRPRPTFLDTDYKIEHASDHVAKFHGDRPRDLEDFALKKINK